MKDFVKKNWFVSILAVLFVFVSVYYIYDTNKGKLKGKTSGGEDVVYEINGENITAAQFYDAMYKNNGVAAIYHAFTRAVADQSVETTEEMKTLAANQANSIANSYYSSYGADYQNQLDSELKSMGYEGYESLEDYLIDYFKLEQIAEEYARDNFDDLQIRNISYLLIKPSAENTEETDEEGTAADDVQTKMDAVDEMLAGGASFAETATAFSEDDTTAAKGGVLGSIDKNTTSLDAAFQEAALALNEGETSDWVYSEQFGYFRIYCNASTPETFTKVYYEQNKVEGIETEYDAESLAAYEDLLNTYDSTLMQKAIWVKGQELGVTFTDETVADSLKNYMAVTD